MTDQLPPFESARLKLARARQHISELQQEVTAFLASTKITLVIDQTPQWAELDCQIIVARGWKPPPASLSAIIGDAVHNLRTALDLLATDLVRLNGNSTKSVYFPFAYGASELKSQIKAKNFDRASGEAVRLLKTIAPYEAGNRFLRAVHDLDIQDKHKALIPAMSAAALPPMILIMGTQPNQLPAWDSPLSHDEQIMVMMPRTPNVPLSEATLWAPWPRVGPSARSGGMFPSSPDASWRIAGRPWGWPQGQRGG
jgi:hypothetical protein